MLDSGDPAPDFDLPRPTADGDEPYRLSAAAREGPVVVAFYPVADVDGAAALLGDLAAVDWAGVTDRVAVLGVGVGGGPDHERLGDAVEVPFPLLLDREGFFAERYGVLESVSGSEDGSGVRSSVFVVDERCFVRGVWTADETDWSLPTDDVASAVASL